MENKKMILIKNKITLVSTLIFCVLLISLVSAGVGFRKVVEIFPGQTHIENLRLQNLAPEDPDSTFEGSILEGNNIVSFDGASKFNVPNGQIVDAPLKIVVPADASIGDIYTVKMVFRSYPVNPVESGASEGSAIQFITGTGISFDVKVIPKPEEETPEEVGAGWIVLAIVLIVIVIAVIWFVVKNKKEVSGKVVKPSKPVK